MGTLIILLLIAVPSISGIFDSFDFYSHFSNNNNCTLNEFICRNGRCVSMQKRCDNHNDCLDSSDEEDCDLYLCKEPKYFRCKNERCISKAFYCNGDNDCEDYSDEENCKDFKDLLNKNSTCAKNEWQCIDKICISSDWVCNGERDCLDGSDETIGCSITIKCDGFKCKNGHCIPNEWKCDGNDDCRDNSDEIDCEINSRDCTWDNQLFLCADNKTCIKLSEVCDEKPQCPDKSDESPLCKGMNMSCNSHRCSHDCVQLPTGPRCLCPKGYHNIAENHCQDINECEIYGICDQKCQNFPGSYKCLCDEGYTLEDDKKTCTVSGGEATILFSSKNEIRAYLLQSQLYFPIAKHLKQVVGIFFNGEHVYWTDIFSEHESIVRSLVDGSKRELLVTSGLGAPEDLAVDWITGNIYFSDAERQHIAVCTNDGSHCTVLINENIHKPRGIVLNSNEGEMYWTDWGQIPEIGRSFMDGSHDVSFVSSEIHWPNGLTIDHPNERLYWTDAKLMTLESIKLDGTDRRVILEGVVKHPYAIAVFENRLFWSDWATHSIQSCDKFTGKNHHTIIKEQKDYIYGISIYHSVLKSNKHNPCAQAMCSDICLISGSTYTCACPQNKELNSDRKTCRDVEKKQMLIIGANNLLIHVEHQILGKHDVTALPLVVKNIGALAYNSVNNTLYISDVEIHKIISLNLHTGASQPLQINKLGKIVAMDYDYFGNNLYLCDEEKRTLEVVNLNTMSRKVLIHDMNNEIPESIALIPTEGIMFVAFKKPYSRETHIDRFLMDGSGRTHPIEHGLLGPVSLLYDEDLHRIFIANSGTGNIESTSIGGDDRHGFRSLQTYPVGIASLKTDIFWVNENSKRVYWAEKLNSDESYNKKITLDIPAEIERMHIISVTPRKIALNPCQFNNGNCSHLCLISQKTIKCACPSGMMLDNNNRTCSKRLHCDDDEFFCPKSNFCIKKELRCNGKKDCDLEEDEENCRTQNHCPIDYFQCNNGECIAESLLCNLQYDCTDKSDEHNCSHTNVENPCPPNHFKCNNDQCIENVFVCDGINDCSNGEDETNCVSTTCQESQFRCLSGSCIPKTWECDHEYDCADYSDEHSQCASCPLRMFTCANGKCIDKNFICNNVDDCGDNSDEDFCTDITTTCLTNEFSCSSNKSICLPQIARCNGTSECPHHEDEENCSNCRIDEFNCENKNCIPTVWLCDHTDDCGDNSDETQSLCSYSTNFSITNQFPHEHCQDGFMCKSGHCIELSEVCNNEKNCYDGSDEGGLCNTSCDSSNNPCSHTCIRTPSGPMCKCRPGFKLLGDGRFCEDINECQSDLPICSQLCINYPGSYMCDCFIGFILRSDKKSCKAEGEVMSLIYTSDNQIRELSQKENSLQLIFSEDTPKITGLDVAVDAGFVYFSIENSGTIHRINKKSKIREYINDVGQPQKLAVDWITNNIYFVNNELSSKSLSICNFNDKVCGKLLDIDIHRQVSAIAVDAVNKLLFYSLTSWWIFNSPSYIIYKSNLDGSEIQELIKSTPGYVTGLAYDLNKKELYYVDQLNGHLSKMNYDGTMNTLLSANLTRPEGLSFFENHLYFLTTSGSMGKCKLYESLSCDSFKLNTFSTELFAIAQKSRQPQPYKNVCQNHTCSHLCVPTKSYYKCLCKNGMVIAAVDKCSSKENQTFNIVKSSHGNIAQLVDEVPNRKHNTASVIAGILIPVCLVAVCIFIYYIIKKRNSGSLNISMRFYNRSYGLQIDDNEKSILQPGQHEYSNPVEFYENQEANSETELQNKESCKLVDV